jgi:hypothetical protein
VLKVKELLYINQTYLLYIWLSVGLLLGVGILVGPIVLIVRLFITHKKIIGAIAILISILFWVGSLILFFVVLKDVGFADFMLDCNGMLLWFYIMFVICLQILLYLFVFLTGMIARLALKKKALRNIICSIVFTIMLISLIGYVYNHSEYYEINNHAFIGRNLDEIEQRYEVYSIGDYDENGEKEVCLNSEAVVGHDLGFDYCTIYLTVNKKGKIKRMYLGCPIGG